MVQPPFPPAVCECLLPLSLATRCLVKPFNCCQSDRWEILSQCSFNLYLFYYELSWTYFHMFKRYLSNVNVILDLSSPQILRIFYLWYMFLPIDFAYSVCEFFGGFLPRKSLIFVDFYAVRFTNVFLYYIWILSHS